MLFKLKLTEVNTTIESNTLEVDELLARVEDLQEENKKLKDYLQQLSSASKAAESALEQLKTAYLMLKKIDHSQMDVFKQEVDHLYLEIKTSQGKSSEQIKPSTAPPLENKTEKTSKNQQSKSSSRQSNSQTKDKEELKAVEVEVLQPEEQHSHYEAVMKLKQLL